MSLKSESESPTELDFDSMMGCCESDFEDDNVSLKSESQSNGNEGLPLCVAKSDEEEDYELEVIKSEAEPDMIDLITESSADIQAPFPYRTFQTR